jgi:hypothetical protein
MRGRHPRSVTLTVLLNEAVHSIKRSFLKTHPNDSRQRLCWAWCLPFCLVLALLSGAGCMITENTLDRAKGLDYSVPPQDPPPKPQPLLYAVVPFTVVADICTVPVLAVMSLAETHNHLERAKPGEAISQLPGFKTGEHVVWKATFGGGGYGVSAYSKGLAPYALFRVAGGLAEHPTEPVLVVVRGPGKGKQIKHFYSGSVTISGTLGGCEGVSVLKPAVNGVYTNEWKQLPVVFNAHIQEVPQTVPGPR